MHLGPVRHLPALLLLATSCCIRGGEHVSIGTVAKELPDVAAVTRIEVQNPVGSIRIEQAEAATVAIEAEVLLHEDLVEPGAKRELVFDEHVQVQRQGEQLRIASAHADAADDWQLRLRIRIPAGRSLQVEQRVGSVQLNVGELPDLRVQVDVGGAELELASCTGKLVAAVGTGELQARVSRALPAGCALQVGVGELDVRLPPDAAGSFELDASVGDVDVDPAYGLLVARQHASVTARGSRGKEGPQHRLEVATGSIRLR